MKLKLVDTDNGMLVPRRKGAGTGREKGGQVFGDGRCFDFG